jgi:hypothetical protein
MRRVLFATTPRAQIENLFLHRNPVYCVQHPASSILTHIITHSHRLVKCFAQLSCPLPKFTGIHFSALATVNASATCACQPVSDVRAVRDFQVGSRRRHPSRQPLWVSPPAQAQAQPPGVIATQAMARSRFPDPAIALESSAPVASCRRPGPLPHHAPDLTD